jgi:hypothetical protein
MMRWALFILVAALGGCGSMGSNKVQGNESGGIVADIVKSEPEQIQMANEHCRTYNKVARITATQKDASGRVIFVCESAPPSPAPNTPSRKK